MSLSFLEILSDRNLGKRFKQYIKIMKLKTIQVEIFLYLWNIKEKKLAMDFVYFS
jgi:hypothetical protein